jgi:lysophospholipase L1-like esterase
MKSSKNFIFFTVMLFFTLSIILSMGEIGMRVFHLVPPINNLYKIFMADPVLPYKIKPLLKLHERSETGEFVDDIATNSLGFRDVEHTYEKNPAAFRILGLGDSFTFGGGAPLEESYLYTLEMMLNQRDGKHQQVEIIKAGIPRYFPEAERLLLEYYGKKYAPDLILVGFLPNDITDTHAGIDAVGVDPSGFLTSREAASLGSIGVFLYSNSFLCRYILKKYMSYREMKHNRSLGDWKEIYKPNGFYEKDWQTVELEFQKMVTIAAELKARIVFIHIPQKGPWDETHFYPAQRLSAFAMKHEAGFVDILPGMMEASANKALYYEKDGHCTPAGYRVIAQQLYRYLVTNKFIP